MSRRFTQLLLAVVLLTTCAFAQKWQPINPEELKMTSVPEAPGAKAVILYRDFYEDDDQYFATEYVRLKVLTEAGRKYADVELPYLDKHKRVMEISARTIHPDGSVVDFDGKVYTKKGTYRGFKTVLKTFTLPDVTVGSIIEYKFVRRWDPQSFYFDTFWDVQDELFQKHVTFLMKPTSRSLTSHDETRNYDRTMYVGLNLPSSAKIQDRPNGLQLVMENVPAFEPEANQPPRRELAMGVYFYLGNSDNKPEKFWRGVGKDWSNAANKYIGHSGAVTEIANQVAPASLPPEERLRKLYARAQQIRNFSFDRERSAKEIKVEDVKPNRSVEEVLKHGYGTQSEINRAFVALARAAGFDANLFYAASREYQFFNINVLSDTQLDDELAVVTLNGKDLFLDPGTLMCPYGLLDWRYTSSAGIRQFSNGETKVEGVPHPDARKAGTSRAANLVLDSDGTVSGTVQVLYQGLDALERRLSGREEDEAAHKKDLEEEAKEWFPNASDVKIQSLINWDDYEKPIKAEFKVTVPGFAAVTGSRMILPNNVFAATYRQTFDHEQRKTAVYFRYPYAEVDVAVVKLPAGVTVENLPAKAQEQTDFAYFIHDRKSPAPGYVRFDRTVLVGDMYYKLEEYPKLRGFFSKLKAEDQQQILLKNATETSAIGGAHGESK
ncbi:MAG TPA: DUF3857 domain-containing protein [Terriglobales bacterium]